MKANVMKKFLLALLLAPLVVLAAGGHVALDKAPNVQDDHARLQNGARLFVNYCLSCHGMSFVRYNRLTEIGLTRQQIEDNLMFTADKIGGQMRVACPPEGGTVFTVELPCRSASAETTPQP